MECMLPEMCIRVAPKWYTDFRSSDLQIHDFQKSKIQILRKKRVIRRFFVNLNFFQNSVLKLSDSKYFELKTGAKIQSLYSIWATRIWHKMLKMFHQLVFGYIPYFVYFLLHKRKIGDWARETEREKEEIAFQWCIKHQNIPRYLFITGKLHLSLQQRNVSARIWVRRVTAKSNNNNDGSMHKWENRNGGTSASERQSSGENATAKFPINVMKLAHHFFFQFASLHMH